MTAQRTDAFNVGSKVKQKRYIACAQLTIYNMNIHFYTI